MPIRMEDDPLDQQDFDDSNTSSGGRGGGGGGGLLAFLPLLLSLFSGGKGGKGGGGMKIVLLLVAGAAAYFFFFKNGSGGGVTDVVNQIEVLPLSNFDDDIRRSIIREFDRRGGSIYRYIQGVNPSMRIIVKNGNVSLEGYVASRGDANLARILVFKVTDNLMLENETER